MRVAIVAESFLPAVNGVTHSVLRILEHLRDQGDQAIVFAPAGVVPGPTSYAGFPIVTLPAVSWPGYSDIRLATTPQYRLERMLEDFAPDVVHLAAPIVLGHRAALAATWLDIPIVAIYQTDIPSYAASYKLGRTEALLWWRMRKLHSMATMTLAPSSAARSQLLAQGIPRVGLWGRGVDSVRFDPAKRDEDFRRQVAPNGEHLIGYVGRLASEKRVEDLACLMDLPNSKLIIVGDGPKAAEIRRALPSAHFTGQLVGEELPRVMASFDVFVHPGELETFCQSIQEALASGVPAIAPAKGGPIDLINSSRSGWLYAPGDLASMKTHVQDLLGDDFKRRAFGRAARQQVEHRTWTYMCNELVGCYHEAIAAKQYQRQAV